MQGLIGVTRIYWKHAAVLLATGALLQIASADPSGQAGAQRSLGFARDKAAPLRVEQDTSKRPRITGIDHVRLYVKDIDKSREFYKNTLGLPERAGCVGDLVACFTIFWDRRQSIELQSARSSEVKNWVAEIAFATDNAAQMRRFISDHGFQCDPIVRGKYGDSQFRVADPEGNGVGFVQRSSAIDDPPPFPENEVGTRLLHAGFVVKSMEAENRFYRDLLGFKLYWYGGFKDDGVDWYEIQVPDGSDWIEYMLNIPANADHKELGVQNHFSLGVKDIHVAAGQLHKNGLAKFDGPEIGRDGKWGLDAYDPDGTRVEIMEFTPAGKPCCHPYTAAHPTP